MRAPAQAGASTLRALEATVAPDFAEVAEVPMPCSDEAAARLSDSPSSPGSWNNRSYDNQEEQLTHEDSHVRGSESPDSTHLRKKRIVVLFVFISIVHTWLAFFHS